MRYLIVFAAALFLAGSSSLAPAAVEKSKPQKVNRIEVVRHLQRSLKGYPLRPYAWAIEAAGWRYNVSPYLIASIAGKESTFGKAACGGNAWGIGSCRWSYSDFRAGAFAEAQLLRTGYLNHGLLSVATIGYRYCVPPDAWIRDVTWFMAHYFGQGPGAVSYPGKRQ